MYFYTQVKSCILAYGTLLNNFHFSRTTNIYTSIAIFFVMIYVPALRLLVSQTLMKIYGKKAGYLDNEITNIKLAAINEFKFRQSWKCCAIVFGTHAS
jgi:hypothetical protein